MTGISIDYGTTSAISGPAPTGNPLIDTTNVQTFINNQQALGKVPVINSDGTFAINTSIKFAGSLTLGGPSQKWLWTGSIGAGSFVFDSDPNTNISNGIFTMNCTIDGGSGADCFRLNNYSHGFFNGNPQLQNFWNTPLVIGTATSPNAFGFKQVGTINFSTTAASLPNSVCLWTQGTDSIFEYLTGGGCEYGFVAQGANTEVNHSHFSNRRVRCGFLCLSQQPSRFNSCFADTFASVTHAGASTVGITSTILDPLAHQFMPGAQVTGTNIPAGAFVGQSGLIPGTSFPLVDLNGNALNTTGAVSGITLLPMGFNAQGNMQINGGGALNNSTQPGVEDNTFAVFGVGNISNTSVLEIANFTVWGTQNTKRFANTIVGQLLNATWTNIMTQLNVVNPVAVSSGSSLAALNQQSATATPNATLNVYGAAVPINPLSPNRGMLLTGFLINIATIGSETLTVQIIANLSLGGTKSITIGSLSSTGNTNSNSANMNGLLPNNGAFITSLSVQVKSTINSSTATITVTALGSNIG